MAVIKSAGILLCKSWVTLENPARSGNFVKFAEVNRAGFFTVEEARKKMNAAQWAFVERLESILSKYSSKTETGKCVFCEIALGNKTPQGNGKYWESEKYIAWLSPFPNTEGFTVVIPKKHYTSDVLKMPDNELSDFIIEVKNISKLLLEYFPNVGRIGLIMEGTGIDHAHIKLIPMH